MNNEKKKTLKFETEEIISSQDLKSLYGGGDGGWTVIGNKGGSDND